MTEALPTRRILLRWHESPRGYGTWSVKLEGMIHHERLLYYSRHHFSLFTACCSKLHLGHGSWTAKALVDLHRRYSPLPPDNQYTTNIQHTVYSSTKLYSRKASSLQCSNAWVKQKISSANSWTSCLRMCIMSRTAGFSSIPCQDWGTKQKPSILLAKWWRSVLEAISSMPLGQDFFTLFYPLQFFWSCRAALQRIRKNCRSQDSPALLGFRSVWWALSRHSCTGNVSCSMKHAQGSNHFPSSSLQLRSECW